MFCSLFTMIHWTTLCVLPFTLVAFSWRTAWRLVQPALRLPGCCGVQCPDPSSPSPRPATPHSAPAPAPLSPDSKRRLAVLSEDPTLQQKLVLAAVWLSSAMFGLTTCFPEKVRRCTNICSCICIWGAKS